MTTSPIRLAIAAVFVALVAAAPCRLLAELCVGDCNEDGQVTVDELVTGVNLALSGGSVRYCREIDSDGNGLVTVDELVQGVNFALGVCPASVDVYRAPAGTDVAGPTSPAVGVLPNGRRVEQVARPSYIGPSSLQCCQV